MPIDRPDFDAVTEGDLVELQAGQVPEGLRLDYKRDLYGNSDAERREALKDISAFANSAGGHLLIGVEEHDGLPVGIPGLAGANPDEAILRLDQMARTGIEPRIPGLRIRSVPLASGAFCIAVRVPRSWNPPHRVAAQNSNRFWVRNSGGSHEASIEELRSMFTQGADAIQRVHDFRDRRMAQLTNGVGNRPLQGGGRLVMHVVPLAAIVGAPAIDLEEALAQHQSFRPIGTMGMTPRFNLHGFINERGGDLNFGYTQVFRNGSIEATYAGLVHQTRNGAAIPSGIFEQRVFEVFPGYVNGLRHLDIPPPLVVLLTLEGINGAFYAVARGHWADPEPPIDVDTLYLPECYVHDYGTAVDYQRALRPAIDALWNSAGYSRAQSFGNDGGWVGMQ